MEAKILVARAIKSVRKWYLRNCIFMVLTIEEGASFPVK